MPRIGHTRLMAVVTLGLGVRFYEKKVKTDLILFHYYLYFYRIYLYIIWVI